MKPEKKIIGLEVHDPRVTYKVRRLKTCMDYETWAIWKLLHTFEYSDWECESEPNRTWVCSIQLSTRSKIYAAAGSRPAQDTLTWEETLEFFVVHNIVRWAFIIYMERERERERERWVWNFLPSFIFSFVSLMISIIHQIKKEGEKTLW